MSEYSERRSKEIEEDVKLRCQEARRAADWWAAHCEEIKSEAEIIKEAKNRYLSFFERHHFIIEAEEIFMYRLSKNEFSSKS